MTNNNEKQEWNSFVEDFKTNKIMTISSRRLVFTAIFVYIIGMVVGAGFITHFTYQFPQSPIKTEAAKQTPGNNLTFNQEQKRDTAETNDFLKKRLQSLNGDK